MTGEVRAAHWFLTVGAYAGFIKKMMGGFPPLISLHKMQPKSSYTEKTPTNISCPQ